MKRRSQNLQQIHVSQLKLGMYVSELDKSWLETPFAVQGMPMNSQRDIDAISNYAENVWIDPLKQFSFNLGELKTTALALPSARQRSALKKIAAENNLQQRHVYSNSTSAAQEHPHARILYSQSKQAVEKILKSVSDTGEISFDDAQRIVDGCMLSVMKNPDALMWMSKIREQDEYTAEHCLNVCVLAMVFGRFVGLPEKEIVQLGLCGLLHDVGKMKMPIDVLNKPEKLSTTEFDIIKTHTLHGYSLLSAATESFPSIVAETARSHHERIDGLGYPNKIPAKNLDSLIRMITLVDAYDAMTSDRCYSKGRSNSDALKNIYEQKGKQFDEDLALAFIRCIGIYPAGTIVQLINGCVGVVVDVNENYRHLPRVIVVKNSAGQNENPYYVNLLDIEFGGLSNDHLVRCTLKSGAMGINISKYLISVRANGDVS
jgi:putative nucleotidyltransferase with HDIG domain